MKTLLVLMILSFGLQASAFAGDAATFKNLGFSADGKTYAFLQYGTLDGAGFPFAQVSVINVARNDLVAGKYVVLEKDGATEKQAVTQALAGANLPRFGIQAGANPGKTLVLRAPTDRSKYDNLLFATSDGQFEPVYELKVEKKAMEDKSEGKWCSELGGEGSPAGFKLALLGASEGNHFSAVLQDDQQLPKGRGCALGYGVSQVIRQGNSLVVIMRYSSVGFEGPDYRYLAVTGTPAI